MYGLARFHAVAADVTGQQIPVAKSSISPVPEIESCAVKRHSVAIEPEGDRRLVAHLLGDDQSEQQDRVGLVQHDRRGRAPGVNQLQQDRRRG